MSGFALKGELTLWGGISKGKNGEEKEEK